MSDRTGPIDDPAGSQRHGVSHDHTRCVRAREQAAVSLLRRHQPSRGVRSHLRACPPCHEEYLALASITPLLESGRQERPTPHAVRRRHRPGALVALVLAGTAAVAVPAAWLVVPHGRADGGPPGPLVAVGTGTAADGVTSAQVWVRERGDGSAVTVRLRGAAVEGRRCRIVVHDVHGEVTEAGTWIVQAPESLYTEEVAAPARDVREVGLVDDGSRLPIVDVPVRPR